MEWYKKILSILIFSSLWGIAQKPCGFRDGLQEGECKRFYDNGQVSEIVNWKNGKEEGNAVFYYKNGNKNSEGKYKKGFKVGVWTFYSEDGKISAKEGWVYRDHMGVQEGEQISYYKNGNVQGKWYYKDGKLDGELVYYGENGNVSHKGVFKNNVSNSFRIFDTDMSFGEGTIRNEDNSLKREGRWIYYRSDGKNKFAEGVYVNDKYEGEWIFYDKNGGVRKAIYKNGVEVTKKSKK